MISSKRGSDLRRERNGRAQGRDGLLVSPDHDAKAGEDDLVLFQHVEVAALQCRQRVARVVKSFLGAAGEGLGAGTGHQVEVLLPRIRLPAAHRLKRRLRVADRVGLAAVEPGDLCPEEGRREDVHRRLPVDFPETGIGQGAIRGGVVALPLSDRKVGDQTVRIIVRLGRSREIADEGRKVPVSRQARPQVRLSPKGVLRGQLDQAFRARQGLVVTAVYGQAPFAAEIALETPLGLLRDDRDE